MNTLGLRVAARRARFVSSSVHLIVLVFGFAATGRAQVDDRLIGIWSYNDGFQVTAYLFRSDGRYQLDTYSVDPSFEFSFTERGRFHTGGGVLSLVPYDYLGEPGTNGHTYSIAGAVLSLTPVEFPFTQEYLFETGSRADVLQREQASADAVGAWMRSIPFFGTATYTFRPGGYYALENAPDDTQFPSEVVRGRYTHDGAVLVLSPYSGTDALYETDFFGDDLTLIKADSLFGEAIGFTKVPGSDADVRAKAQTAAAFLAAEHWQVGVWEIRDPTQTVDLTIRPDGYYAAENHTEFLAGVVRGRYDLEPGFIHLAPFVGQGLYSPDNGEFGTIARTRAVDYYDGELQLIDLNAISQSVTLARKRAGSQAAVSAAVQQAQTERAVPQWFVGEWEVHDPAGWMAFTFRPDGRYIVQSGAEGEPWEVERGRYRFTGEKVTLSPYAGLGGARGFELDLYEGDVFLVGDLLRLVVARKVPGSEVEVIAKTVDPESARGERGPILGLWTADLPGQSSRLVFRDDGEFRLTQCASDVTGWDYGIFAAGPAARTLIYDSRFVPVQSLELDYYGDTLTLHGGSLGPPVTYTANPGLADAAMADSRADDAAEALVDQQWMPRTPIAPRDPNAVHQPGGGIPADPNPGQIFADPTVFSSYQLYRRLVPGLVFFNEQGTIRSLPVVNTREWHYFPTGRVLVRFTDHRAGLSYPSTFVDVTDTWGAYRITPKPDLQDILHRYADHGLQIAADSGEQADMTLEDGRRHLFWGKDFQILSQWAAEQQPVPCTPAPVPDRRLLNVRVSLSTDIPPDPIAAPPTLSGLRANGSGAFVVSGALAEAGALIVDQAGDIRHPALWQPAQTNALPAGAFELDLAAPPGPKAYFRLRVPEFGDSP